MRQALVIIGGALMAGLAWAGAGGREIAWPAQDKLPKEATLHAAGKVAKQVVLEVKAGAAPVQILEINDPKAPHHHYVLRGRIRYAGVDQAGHLEMWSHFADGNKFFTRTLGAAGPLAKIQGDSDWRDLALPFMSKEGYLPSKLVINVVLPGRGTIYLTPLTLSKVE